MLFGLESNRKFGTGLIFILLTTVQPAWLSPKKVTSVQSSCTETSSSSSSSIPSPSSSSLKITNRPLRYASPCLWNNLPFSKKTSSAGVPPVTPAVAKVIRDCAEGYRLTEDQIGLGLNSHSYNPTCCNPCSTRR